MKKSLHTISLALLGIVLLSGIISVDAASRLLVFNASDQSNKTSSEMYVKKEDPISYMVVVGDTSRGSIRYEIVGINESGSTYTVLTSGICSVGQTLGIWGCPHRKIWTVTTQI